VGVRDGREADDAAVARRGDREAGAGRVEAVGGRGERRGREGGGGGEGGRDELLGHGVELGEQVLQIPHLALPGVGASASARARCLLLERRRGVVGCGGLDDGHRSRPAREEESGAGRGGGEGSEGSGRPSVAGSEATRRANILRQEAAEVDRRRGGRSRPAGSGEGDAADCRGGWWVVAGMDDDGTYAATRASAGWWRACDSSSGRAVSRARGRADRSRAAAGASRQGEGGDARLRCASLSSSSVSLPDRKSRLAHPPVCLFWALPPPVRWRCTGACCFFFFLSLSLSPSPVVRLFPSAASAGRPRRPAGSLAKSPSPPSRTTPSGKKKKWCGVVYQKTQRSGASVAKTRYHKGLYTKQKDDEEGCCVLLRPSLVV
jgi:hypothetical protein